MGFPWKNGIYRNAGLTSHMTKVDGKTANMLSVVCIDYPDTPPFFEGEWISGDFGPAKPQVKEAAGGKVDNYNIEMVFMNGLFRIKGIVCEGGDKIVAWGMSNKVEVNEWIDEEQLQKFKDDREDIKSYTVPYKLQPDNVGKLVWLSGPPGAGKSTSGQLMARDAGFVYYEADCTMAFLNPFVPTNVDNPTMAAFQQKPLKGFTKDIVDALMQAKPMMDAMASNNIAGLDWNAMKPFYKVMAEDVAFQHKRIGGNFAIAQAVANRTIRDHIRETIPDVIFVVLNLTKETQIKRLKERHGDGVTEDTINMFSSLHEAYEMPWEGEENTFQVDITEDMTRNDVMNKILETLEMQK